MKHTKFVLAALTATISLASADALIKKATDAGLKGIPTDHGKLMQLINDPKNMATPAKVKLGEMLYFEPRLSKSGVISCNTCHNLATGGVDGVAAAIGHKWTANPHHLNSPTVYNSVFNTNQFWDGRSPHLEDQAKGPMQAAPEMAINPKVAAEKMKSIPEYVELFKKAFPTEKDPVTFENIAKSIAAFERKLVTPSRYDDFLNGKANALNKTEKEGLAIFIDKGCVSCHNGTGVGGTAMQKFPLMGQFKHAALGDFKGDKEGNVKVPTLRNIGETAPYFHNGSVWSLSEAVQIMGETQLGAKLTADETTKLVAFLNSLTGKKPKVIYPVLPASTDKTPRPDAN